VTASEKNTPLGYTCSVSVHSRTIGMISAFHLSDGNNSILSPSLIRINFR